MVDLAVPDPDRLAGVNDARLEDFPAFARVERGRDPPAVEDAGRAAVAALADLEGLDDLPRGARVAVTAGSRGIHDMPAILRAIVADLDDRGLEPFVLPAMGSHGGATAEGQVAALESLGMDEDALGCPIESSMAVETIGEDRDGRPVVAARDALEADAVVLANRVKLHTDFRGSIESGLCKMAVIGLGKHRGAESAHNAALARGFEPVIRERAAMVFDALPIVGGIGVIENANERAAAVEGVPVDAILDREPALLDRSRELFPELPVDDLDLLIVDRMGKDVSGTGMDTNVLGRVRFHGQPEPDSPAITRIYVRELTEASHGNGLGVGLADFAHERVVEALDLDEMYVNVATSGEPSRAAIPFVVPSDAAALLLAHSTTGARDPSDLRIARIPSTLDPDTLLASEPVVRELEGRDDVTVGERAPLAFDADGEFAAGF